MDFVVGLPRTQNAYDFIWVVFDRFTKSARFSYIMSTYSPENYDSMFIYEIECNHGIPFSIISDRGHNSYLGFGGCSNKGWVLRWS